MGEDGEEAEPNGTKVLGLSFSPTISVGTLIVLIGMLGGGLTVVFTVGGQTRGLQDQVTHETEMRTLSQSNLAEQLGNVQKQSSADLLRLQKSLADSVLMLQSNEQRDVASIDQNVRDLHNDVRTLMQNSGGGSRYNGSH
jgi:hypothetical protein